MIALLALLLLAEPEPVITSVEQVPAADVPTPAALWGMCVRGAALRYAKLPDPAGDLADAALGTCLPMERLAHDSFVEELRGHVDPLRARNEAANIVERIRANLRLTAMSAISEARVAPRK